MRDDGVTSGEGLRVRLSERGQVTVPSSVRQRLDLEAGDTFHVRVDNGRLILDPVPKLEVELYDAARIAEFERASAMSDAELRLAERAWRRRG